MGADVGIHFFNPVGDHAAASSSSARPDTDDEHARDRLGVRREARASAPVLVADAPGVRRQPRPDPADARSSSTRSSTATRPDEADEAILRLGLPMAPSVLLQMVGPRVANHVLETLHDAYPDRFPLSADPRQLAPRARTRSSSRRTRRGRPRRSWRPRSTPSRRDSPPARRGRRRGGGGRRHRASCSAPAGRSGSAASRSTSTRPADRRGCSGDRSPRPARRGADTHERRLAHPHRASRRSTRRGDARPAPASASAPTGEELAKELEGHRLAVSRDDTSCSSTHRARPEAEQARRVVEAELADEGLEAQVEVEHWLADEERWDDEPPSETWEEEELERGYAPWEVRVECDVTRRRSARRRARGGGLRRRRAAAATSSSAATREDEARRWRRASTARPSPAASSSRRSRRENPFAVFGGLGGSGTPL